MADEKTLKQAQTVFETLCRTMDAKGFHYEKQADKLSIFCSVRGEDLPIELNIAVDAERRLVMFLSHIPVVTPEDKRLDMAVAVSIVNNKLVDGSFDYDVTSGHMFFRLTSSFLESVIGEEVFLYMLLCASQTIDEYNDKFLMLAKGMMSLEQFVKADY